MTKPTVTPGSGQVQSLVRALSTLEELARHPNGLTLTELAKIVGLPRSTTHRLLTTMNTLRFVDFDCDNNHWKVGPQAFSVGAAFGGVKDLARLGRPLLRAINICAKETVSLSVPERHSQLYVGQVVSTAPAPASVRTGDRLPIHFTAAGKSVMAFWSDDTLSEHLTTADFYQRTERSTCQPARIIEKLALYRERGYAFDCEESFGQLRCVGAPVFNAYGEPIAAISVSAAASRMEKPRMHAIGRELRAAALKLTREMGGKAPSALFQ